MDNEQRSLAWALFAQGFATVALTPTGIAAKSDELLKLFDARWSRGQRCICTDETGTPRATCADCHGRGEVKGGSLRHVR